MGDIDLDRRLIAVHRGRHAFVVPGTGVIYALTKRKTAKPPIAKASEQRDADVVALAASA